jgi:hypothetical protein
LDSEIKNRPQAYFSVRNAFPSRAPKRKREQITAGPIMRVTSLHGSAGSLSAVVKARITIAVKLKKERDK